MSRPSLEETLMAIALEWSKRSTCSSRVAVGAVLVNSSGQIIASGFNGAPRGLPHCDEVGCDLDTDGHCLRAIHAEENAIIQCAVNGTPTVGGILYVTHSPCVRCCGRIIQAQVSQVVYLHKYRDAQKSMDILASRGILMIESLVGLAWLED